MSFSGDAHPVPAPRRVLSQAAFDDLVQENVDEFGMSRAEAASDALSQFVSMGVDLTGVVTDGSDVSSIPVISALNKLRAFFSGAGDGEDPTPPLAASSAPAVASALAAVTLALTAGGPSEAARARAIARSNGGVTLLSTALASAHVLCVEESGAHEAPLSPALAAVLAAALVALRAACVGYDDARLEVSIDTIRIVARAVSSSAMASNRDSSDVAAAPPFAVARAAILLATTFATKREDAKAELFKVAALPRTLATLLRRALSLPEGSPFAEEARNLARDASVLLARVLTDDDMRAQASRAYEFACIAAGRSGETSATLPSRAPRVPFVGARASAARAQAAMPLDSASSAASYVSEGTGAPLASEGTGVPQPPSEAGNDASTLGGGASIGGGGGGDGCAAESDDNTSALIPLLLAAAERFSTHMYVFLSPFRSVRISGLLSRRPHFCLPPPPPLRQPHSLRSVRCAQEHNRQ
jgi:hypothetical protein